MAKRMHIDCANGIAGDMMLGALLDSGVPLDDLRRELQRLPVKGWKLEAEPVKRGGIAGTRANVIVDDHHHHPHRHYTDIRAMLDSVALPGRAGERAQRAFALLANAEAAVHDIPVEKVHFHEVGAVDAIIDIVGSMIALDMTGVERFTCATVTVGSGEVKCAHGIMPVPAPATARLLEGAPIEAGPVALEMTTPTGAAILRALAPEFGPMPPMRLEKTAYGAGSRIIEGRTNFLRLSIGEPLADLAGLDAEQLNVLTCEIDDMNPEYYGPLLDRLFAAGCRDAALTPIQMKKGRPGVSVHVLADESRSAAMLEILLRHSSTFGVKCIAADRYCLRREKKTVKTPFGDVGVKIGYWGDEILKAAPEFEDCRRLAGAAGVPIDSVYQSARRAADNREWA